MYTHVDVVALGEAVVDGDGHRSDLHGPEVAVDQFRAVGQEQEDPVLHLHPQVQEGVAEAVNHLIHLAVGDLLVLVANGHALAPPLGHVAVDESGYRVVCFCISALNDSRAKVLVVPGTQLEMVERLRPR